MAASYDLELLVRSNREDGFGVTRRLNEQIRQKLILLLMTNPGERVMNGNFGVGLNQYLFYSEKEFETGVAADFSVRISDQITQNMGYIDIESIDMFTEGHNLGLRIEYSVPELYDGGGVIEVLEFKSRDGDIIDINYSDISTRYGDGTNEDPRGITTSNIRTSGRLRSYGG